MIPDREAYRRAAIAGGAVAVAVALVAAGVAALTAGGEGAAGAGIGGALGLVLVVSGPFAMLAGGTRVERLLAIVVLTWIAGIALAIGVFTWARSFAQPTKLSLGLTCAACVVFGIGAIVLAVWRARVPYVDRKSN